MWTVSESSFTKTAEVGCVPTGLLPLGVVMRRTEEKNKQRQVETCREPGEFLFHRRWHTRNIEPILLRSFPPGQRSDPHAVGRSAFIRAWRSLCAADRRRPSGRSGSVTTRKNKDFCSVSFLGDEAHVLLHHVIQGKARCGLSVCLNSHTHTHSVQLR